MISRRSGRFRRVDGGDVSVNPLNVQSGDQRIPVSGKISEPFLRAGNGGRELSPADWKSPEHGEFRAPTCACSWLSPRLWLGLG